MNRSRHIHTSPLAFDVFEREIAGILKAIEDGMYTSSLKEQMAALKKQNIEITALLAALADPPVVRFHPRLSENPPAQGHRPRDLGPEGSGQRPPRR